MIVAYALETLKLNAAEDDILQIICNSYTNDFSHNSPGSGEVHMMLPLTAMLNHSCFPNISRSFYQTSEGFKMRVVASRPIKKGDQIFNSYIDILDPVMVRKKHLLETKNMNCCCERCLDPSDLGSFGSSLLCPRCKIGPLVPPKPDQDQSLWLCHQCGATTNSGKVADLTFYLDDEQKALLSSPEKKSIHNMEKMIKKFSSKLHQKNLLIVRLKYNLIGLYGRERGYTTQEMSEKQWTRKRDLCEEILETLKVLEPGMTVRKARLMYELHLPLVMLAQERMARGEDKKVLKKEFQRGLVTLKLAVKVFQAEPVGSWEQEMAGRSQDTVKQIQEIIDRKSVV